MIESLLAPEDLEIEVWPPRQIGGQQVSCMSRGVKITHLPTGLVAIVELDRSQHRNKAIALDMILGGLTSPHFRG